MSTTILDQVWGGTTDTWQWLRGVVMGEWEDNRSISQIVTDAMTGFVPGVGSIITLRDLLAVIVRLARHPEKRDDVNEWILLIAMLLPLLLTVGGLVIAGIGALVGAELGGFIRALTLFLVKKGGVALKSMVEFFQAHGYGDVIKALKQVQFAKYKGAVIKGFNQQIDKLIKLIRGFEARLKALSPESLPSWLPGRDGLIKALHACPHLVEQLEALRKKALDMIPKALIEMDQRLGALLAGNIKAATQVTHVVMAGQAAPEVARLENRAAQQVGARNHGEVLKNPHAPEPGNTRRVPERKIVALAGEREYKLVDGVGRPVGAKPYKAGVTKLENPALEMDDWIEFGRPRLKEGWPDLGIKPRDPDYATFAHQIRPLSVPAGSPSTFKRVVSHDEGAKMDRGAFWNREAPIDGEDLRAGSAVKEAWNKNGQAVSLRVPPKGHPIWQELHALQEKAAGAPVPFKEELKFWEGPAASQAYKKKADGRWVDDEWYLPGGKPQQFFDRAQMEVLQKHGFISERSATNFPDFDPEVGNIVNKEGPFFQ
ncbi:MAG: hypothetical protein KGL57_13045, partial [Burkholderiales bacterium]|nr:hypothetical protein [Burkholderiales bacterium]